MIHAHPLPDRTMTNLTQQQIPTIIQTEEIVNNVENNVINIKINLSNNTMNISRNIC